MEATEAGGWPPVTSEFLGQQLWCHMEGGKDFQTNLLVNILLPNFRELRGNRLSPRSLSREREKSCERREEAGTDSFRMETMSSSTSGVSIQEEAQEVVEDVQEETSFEGGTTWYTGDEEDGGSSSCDTPRTRGSIHDV